MLGLPSLLLFFNRLLPKREREKERERPREKPNAIKNLDTNLSFWYNKLVCFSLVNVLGYVQSMRVKQVDASASPRWKFKTHQLIINLKPK